MGKETLSIRSTTVLLVRKDGRVALAGDGQVTLGETIMKASAKKVRRLYNDRILAGFAGATALIASRMDSALFVPSGEQRLINSGSSRITPNSRCAGSIIGVPA